MHPHLGIFAVILATTVLAGCGSNPSVTQNQCVAGDWQTLGYRDGVNGLRATRLLSHQDACVEHGIVPDRHEYMIGWDEGILQYCQSDNGYDQGVRGASYNNVCPRHLESAFLSSFHDGQQLYIARTEVTNLERLIDQREQRLAHVKAEIVSSATDQFDPTLTPAQRIEMIAHSQRLLEEKVAIEKELPKLRHDLEHMAEQLDKLQRTMAGVVY